MARGFHEYLDIGNCKVPIVRLCLDLWVAHWIGRSGKHIRVFGTTKEELWNAIGAAVREDKKGV